MIYFMNKKFKLNDSKFPIIDIDDYKKSYEKNIKIMLEI